MSDSFLAPDPDRLAMRSVGALAAVTAQLDAIAARLVQTPDWTPAAPLTAQLDWVRSQVDQMGASWGSKLVVAIVGPSGAGKSTLLNALAGREISPTGLNRPTTRQVVAYAAQEADLAGLLPRWGEDAAQVEIEPNAPSLEYLLLVDSPDTNTTHENQALLRRVLETADVVLAVFPAQNPRLHDNIRFLAPYLRRIPAESVTPVINMVDRVALNELNEDVAPDLRGAIAREWGHQPEHVYLVSARASLPGRTAIPDEAPLHDTNEFPALQRMLFESLNRASQVVDRRLARADHLLAMLEADVEAAIRQHADALDTADAALGELDTHVVGLLRGILSRRGRGLRGIDLHAALYGRLASRWWGLVGWLVGLWGLLVRSAAWVAGLGRGGRDRAAASIDLSEVSTALDGLYAERWPTVADALLRAGFSTAVRDPDRWREQSARTRDRLVALGQRVLDEAVERSARRLSSVIVQVLFNAPPLALLGWIGYETVLGFISGSYLSGEYFENAGMALLAVWAFCFVLLQIVISLAVRLGLQRRAARALADAASWTLAADIQAQLDALRR